MISRSMEAQEQDFLYAVALNAMIPLAKERTLQAVYYILRGRKASQTVQDVHLYSLYPYYRMFPHFSKENWDKIVSNLVQRDFIQVRAVASMNGKSTFLVTKEGVQYAAKLSSQFDLHRWFAPFSSELAINRLDTFWKKLHLSVQTVSQIAEARMDFLPVVTDRRIQSWVKSQLSSAAARQMWQAQLGDELYELWSPYPVQVQQILAGQLTGARQTGRTTGQLAVEMDLAPSYFQLLFRYGLASSAERLQREMETFPVLKNLLDGEWQERGDTRLSESAAKTYALVQRGHSRADIARMRRIKESTVEDHLVEMALRCPEWDASAYLSPDLASAIVHASEKLGTGRLRLIKDHLGAEVSYLHIRLALARKKGEATS